MAQVLQSKFKSSFSYILQKNFNYITWKYYTVDIAYSVLHQPVLHNRPLMLMIHGLLGNKNNFTSVGKKMGKSLNYKIISCDMRNHGSSPHMAEMNYMNMSDDVLRLLDKLGVNDCILLGHSMGGRVAMHTALTNPSRINKAIIVDVSPVGTASSKKIKTGGGSAIEYIKYMQEVSIPSNVMLSQARKNINEQVLTLIPDPSIRGFVLSNLVERHKGHFEWRVNIDAILQNIPFLNSLPGDLQYVPFTKESLFIGGQDSPYISDSDVPEIKRLFPESEIVHIPNCGHWVHAEKPEQFMSTIVQFLTEHI